MNAWSRIDTAKAVPLSTPKPESRRTIAPSYTPRPLGENGMALARFDAKRTKAVWSGPSRTPRLQRNTSSVMTSKTHISSDVRNSRANAVPRPWRVDRSWRMWGLRRAAGPMNALRRTSVRNQNNHAARAQARNSRAPTAM